MGITHAIGSTKIAKFAYPKQAVIFVAFAAFA
jgi:hypothetical protein